MQDPPVQLKNRANDNQQAKTTQNLHLGLAFQHSLIQPKLSICTKKSSSPNTKQQNKDLYEIPQ